MTLDEAIESYSALRMGGYKPTTRKAHLAELARFAAWVRIRAGCDDLPLTDVGPEILARYMDPRRPPVLAASSFNNYRQYLVTFFGHCNREGWIAADPLRYVKAVKVRRDSRLQLTPAQVVAMMDGVDPRDRFAIALGFNTALRVGDVARLTVGAIDRDAGYLTDFVRKTQHEMRLPVTEDLLVELDRWLAHYFTSTGGDGERIPPHWLLVPSMHYQAVNLRRPELGTVIVYRPLHPLLHAERIVHRGLEVINLPTYKEGFHTLRRSTARHLYNLAQEETGHDPIRIVQSQLGHASQKITEKYLGIQPDQVARDELLRFKPFLTWQRPSVRDRAHDRRGYRDQMSDQPLPAAVGETMARAAVAVLVPYGGAAVIVWDALRQRVSDRMHRTTESIIDQVGADHLAFRLAESPEFEALVVNALDTAARTGYEPKRWLLARVIVNAAVDDARVDEGALIARALRDLDAPEIRALERLRIVSDRFDCQGGELANDPTRDQRNEAIFDASQAEPEPVLAALVRAGVAAPPTILGGGVGIAFLTTFGHALLDALRRP